LFHFLSAPPEGVALEDAATGESWSYRRLTDAATSLARELETGRRELVFCFCRRDAPSVIAYLAGIAAGHAVALLDDEVPAPLQAGLLERFRPAFVIRPSLSVERLNTTGIDIHPELQVLLSTSGTTGSPKFVRLTGANLDANAQSIADYLELTADERPIASLPMHYSYGLSVLHSHLAVGATIVFSPHSVMRPEFWDDFRAYACTSFAGVPSAYAILERTGFRDRDLPSLRTMTQAGGRMEPEMVVRYHDHLAARGARLVVMYGQTEATARISYIPPNRLPDKAATIGVPIPRGSLQVVDESGFPVPPGTVGELVYEGPNVMQGYATYPDDLSRGDELGGRLPTGDLGYVDGDGFFVVTGRSKRIAKVYGLRINLDEVEQAMSGHGPVAAVSGADRIVVFLTGANGTDPRTISRSLAAAFALTPRAFAVREIDALPLLPSGKVDYRALGALTDDG
jgi:long-chain acyl-CoA synthetase